MSTNDGGLNASCIDGFGAGIGEAEFERGVPTILSRCSRKVAPNLLKGRAVTQFNLQARFIVSCALDQSMDHIFSCGWRLVQCFLGITM
jgi:hypothetical protein